MYESSSESSIEHGNFPSVINLYAVGEKSVQQAGTGTSTTKTSSASQTYSTRRPPLDPKRGDPFLALAASSSASYSASRSRNQFNDDEGSYASSPTYAEPPSVGCHQPVVSAMTSSSVSRSSASKAPATSHDRQGSCGSPQSSDSDTNSTGGTPRQRRLSSSSSTTSSEELRPAVLKARIWNAASSGLRKPPKQQAAILHQQRSPLNIVGSPSPSSNTVSSGGSTNNPAGCGRHSLISQFSSATGRMETVLAESIVESIALQCTGGVADSGISNTSPETQSSTEFHSILASTEQPTAQLLLGGKRPRRGLQHQHQQQQAMLNQNQLPQPLIGILKPPSAPRRTDYDPTLHTGLMQEAFKSALSNILSGIYCLLICSLGILIPISIVAKQSPTSLGFEGFYIYLYLAGISFLAYVYAFLVRDGSNRADVAASSRSHRSRGVRLRSAAQGGLYLRLGAIAFGIASMIRDGMSLAASLQHGSSLAVCSNPVVPVRAALAIVFTFVQLNFVFFMNAKMCIQKYKVVARLGLAHLVATNACVWLRTVLLDASDPATAMRSSAELNATVSTTTMTPARVSNSSCATETDSVIRGMIVRSDPYLYPVTVQYCALSAAILCTVWQNVGKLRQPLLDSSTTVPGVHDNEEDEDEEEEEDYIDVEGTAAIAAAANLAMNDQRSPHRLLSTRRRHRRSTCSGSHRGLFLGLASLVCSAVALLTAAALAQQSRYRRAASLVSHCSELLLLTACLAAVLAAFPRTADLMYAVSRRRQLSMAWPPLDECIQLLSFSGVCLYWLAGLTLSAGFQPISAHRLLTCLGHPLQAAAQTALLCTARRRRCYKALHAKEKPGRELVTYLLLANIALIMFAAAEPARHLTVESASSPDQPAALSMVERVSLPLHCLYRFHSVALLANVWKEVYRFKSV